MIKHPLVCTLLLLIFSLETAFADARKSKFFDRQKASEYISLGGMYSSDKNSKEYRVSGTYEYIDNHFIHQIDLLSQTRYSRSYNNGLIKNRELYDGEISNKILIGQSSNYFNYYNRSKYDKLSNYYHDLTNAIGWGRIFFGGVLEADVNVGYNEIKNFESQIIINPNLKATFWLTDKVKFTTKAYLFRVRNGYYEELKSRISYKINNDLSLELHHNFDQKSFFYKDSRTSRDEINRDLIFRIKYNF